VEALRQTVGRARTYYDALFRWLRKVVFTAIAARGTPPHVSAADLEIVAEALTPPPKFSGDFLLPMSVRRFFTAGQWLAGAPSSKPTAGAGAGAGAGTGAGDTTACAAGGDRSFEDASLVQVLGGFHHIWGQLAGAVCESASRRCADASKLFVACSFDAFADAAEVATDLTARVAMCYDLPASCEASSMVAVCVDTMMDEDGQHSNIAIVKRSRKYGIAWAA